MIGLLPPSVSVIVPVYNAAPTLDRCIRSILAQDYVRFELLLVNDGSTDRSAEICRSYADSRIRVLDKPNGGPAAARNFGLDHCSAEAEKVCFVDSDDYVEPDYLSRLLSLGGDLAVTAPVHHNTDGSESREDFAERRFTSVWDSREFFRTMANGIMNPPWGKMFSLGIIRSHALRFPDIRILEDVSFNFSYLEHCSSVAVAAYPTYHYVHRPGSETARADMEIACNYRRFHQRLRGLFAASLSDEVDRFIYPQYMGLILRFIRKGDNVSARRMLAMDEVRKSFSAHRPGPIGERIVKILLQLRLLPLVKPLI